MKTGMAVAGIVGSLTAVMVVAGCGDGSGSGSRDTPFLGENSGHERVSVNGDSEYDDTEEEEEEEESYGDDDDDDGGYGDDDDDACPPKEDENEGRLTGGGSVFTTLRQRVTHGFQLRCDADDERQNLQVNWGGNRFHLTGLTTASCPDTGLSEENPEAGFDTFIGTGTGRFNGVDGATIVFAFTDDGDPGDDDTATIEITDASGTVVLEVSGDLRRGNHQAHPE